jgi:hypothetical protein
VITLTSGGSTLTLDGAKTTLTAASINLDGGDDAAIHCGATGFSATKGGDADMNGTKTTITAKADAVLTGVNATVKGTATTTINSAGPTSIEGAIVKLN